MYLHDIYVMIQLAEKERFFINLNQNSFLQLDLNILLLKIRSPNGRISACPKSFRVKIKIEVPAHDENIV